MTKLKVSPPEGQEVATGSLIAQFETAEGQRTGPQIDVPVETTPEQLQLIINQLLSNEDKVPYSFYVSEEEVPRWRGHGMVCHGVSRHGMTRHDKAWNVVGWHARQSMTARYGMAQCRTAWHGTIWR